MASTKVKAIVIGGKDIKEKDKLVTLFSLEKGVFTATLKGVRGDKAKLKMAKDPFSFGDFIIEEGQNSNIITGFDMIDNFYNLVLNLDKYYEACCLLDIVAHSLTEPSPSMFLELIKALKTICYQNAPKYFCVDKFLISIFKDAGYGFLSEQCGNCGKKLEEKYFNIDIGDFICKDCSTPQCILVPDTCAYALDILNKIDYDDLTSIKIEGHGEIQAYNLLKLNFRNKYNYSIPSKLGFD